MPRALEKKLQAQAKRKHFGKERTDRYVYGTLRRLGYPVGRSAQKSKRKKRRR